MQALRSRKEAADAAKARAESSAAIVVRKHWLRQASQQRRHHKVLYFDPTTPSTSTFSIFSFSYQRLKSFLWLFFVCSWGRLKMSLVSPLSP
jgi:hypothetical protein